MSINQELRKKVVEELDSALRDFRSGVSETGDDTIPVDAVTLTRAAALLKAAGVEAVWTYYTNDEGRARWRCSYCGKICRRHPQDKRYCSHCGKPMRLES